MTDHWNQERAKLKRLYQERGITHCEYPGCWSEFGLTLAHKNKRRNTTQKELGSFEHTLLLCLKHHRKIEYDKEKTLELFKRLRG